MAAFNTAKILKKLGYSSLKLEKQPEHAFKASLKMIATLIEYSILNPMRNAATSTPNWEKMSEFAHNIPLAELAKKVVKAKMKKGAGKEATYGKGEPKPSSRPGEKIRGPKL